MADPEIVLLLADIDHGRDDRVGFYHLDGRPFTLEELALLAQASPADEEAARRYSRAAAELKLVEAESRLADLLRLRKLVVPYFDRLRDGATLPEVREVMTAADAAEYDAILARRTLGGRFV